MYRIRWSVGGGTVPIAPVDAQDNPILLEAQGTIRDLCKGLQIDVCASVFLDDICMSRLPVYYQNPELLVSLPQSHAWQE
jgi:hypothetical protein